MSLSEKYNIPKATIQKMVNDGVIACSWPKYEEIYEDFKRTCSGSYKNITAVYIELSEKHNVSEKTVRDAINRFK